MGSGPRIPRLVSFEGIDGAGKSTLLPLVREALEQNGVDAVFTREETTTFLGDAVRRAVSEGLDPFAIIHLFLADRAQHLQDLEGPMREGRLVVTDRYHDSTRAYQGVALGEALGGVDRFEKWLSRVVDPWLVTPVRTYLLDIDVGTALKRLDSRTEVGGYEKQGFLDKVRERYLRLAQEEPDRWVVLDATRIPQELSRVVIEDLERSGLIAHSRRADSS